MENVYCEETFLSEGNILSDTKYVSGTNFVHKETNINNDPHIYLTNNKKRSYLASKTLATTKTIT